jgi:chitodextrinase
VFAATKYTALAAASFALILALALSGAAAGGRIHAGGRDHYRWHDRVPPSAPTNLRATSATPSTVALAWNASTDDVGVAGYYLYVDQNRVKLTGTSYTAYGLQCGESVNVWIVAFDTSNNRSLATTATVSTAACPDLQPPSAPTGFQQQATTQTGAVLTWSASSDNVGVVGYDVYRNLALVTHTAQPTATLGGLSCGYAYQYQVDAYDAAGNHSSRSSIWVQTTACGDSQPPTAPSDLKLTAHTGDSLSFSWTASSDNVTVAGYRVSVNGASATTVTETSATVTLLSCGTPYSVTVDAYDAAGNHSQPAATTATTDDCPAPSPPPPSPPPPPAPQPPPADTTPPTQPAGFKLAASDQTSVTLAWAASTDDTGVTGYDVYVNGTSSGVVTQTGTTVSGLRCGNSYTFAIDAYDAAGNHSLRASLTGSTAACATPGPAADTSPPTTPGNLAVASATQTSVSLTWSASTDNVGVTGYGVYRDGTSMPSVIQPGAAVSGLTCGTSYILAVDAYDAAGNHSARAQVTASTAACADSQPPTAPANVSASSRTATSIALTWAASSDNVGVTGYGLYKSGAQASTVTGTTGIFSGLICNTNYTLAVDAYDAAGNHSAKTTVMVSTTACPDTTPPSTPTGLAASNIGQTSLDLGWNASTDNVAVTGYDVYRGGTKMATVTSTSSGQTGLACGTSYTFGVVAFDAAGNRSQQAPLNVSTSACSPTPPPPPSPPPASGVFYVDPNGSDSTGDGSQSKPWKTIAKAASSTPGGAGNTIHVNAGTYTESSTINLSCKTNLQGAGGRSGATTVKGSADPLISVSNCTDTGNTQSVSGLKLDGQNRTAGTRGMNVNNVRGLAISDMDVESFKGPASGDVGGGAINIAHAWNLDLGNSTLRNSGSVTGSACTGTLGLGEIYSSTIHDLTVSDDRAYGVKDSLYPSHVNDTDFSNLNVSVSTTSCSSWNTLAFELFDTDAVNTTIRNSSFNATVSLTDTSNSAPLSSGFRYHLHNNRWDISTGSEYAIELDQDSTEIDHNYFDGGLYPIANFTGQVHSGNSIHHNVFDNQQGPTAAMHITAGTLNAHFYNNTVVLRQSSWRDGVFSLALAGFNGSTIAINDNIFTSTYSIGDKLGLGLGAATINHNSFNNITSEGTNVVGGSASLPLSGGFPNAYIPSSGSSAASLGAFASGTWSAGSS